MKKSRNRNKPSKKISTSKAIKQVLKENKPLFAAFGTGFVLVLVIGSTFAWSSYSSWVKNHMQSEVGTLDVKIIEEFEQDSVFEQGKKITKKVDVKNISKNPAIVRVQFEESTATFKVDDSTGMLQKKKKESSDKVATTSDVNSWEKDNIYQGKLEKEKFYVIGDSKINYQYKFQETDTRPNLLKPFSLVFSNRVKAVPDVTSTEPYWLYDDGFFYYSKVLEGGTQSGVSVLEAVNVLKENLVNPSKNKLYKIDVSAYGVRANSDSLAKWAPSQSVVQMYEADDKFEK